MTTPVKDHPMGRSELGLCLRVQSWNYYIRGLARGQSGRLVHHTYQGSDTVWTNLALPYTAGIANQLDTGDRLATIPPRKSSGTILHNQLPVRTRRAATAAEPGQRRLNDVFISCVAYITF
jgi:hypothetical protein